MDRLNIDITKTKENLRKYRIQNKLTVKFLTEVLNRTEQAIYQWENPNYQSLPPIEDLYTLAKLYEVSIEDLLILV